MRKWIGALLLALAIWGLGSACAEVRIEFSPAEPRLGDYVDIQVITDREGALSVVYTLSTLESTVFTGEADTHFTSAFRPREEAQYTLTATVWYDKKGKDTESASVIIPVSGVAPEQRGADVVYSQKDGWWKSKKYNIRTVEKAGCALFALSHALQRMGIEGDEILPDALAVTYANCYIKDRGTANSRLLNLAGEAYDFISEDTLNESVKDIAACIRRGDYFSFSIVIGHIALVDGVSADGTKVHIVDSASGATFERIKNGTIYYQDEAGNFIEAPTPDALPGNRYFFETREWGGMGYWLDTSYCAKRGMRLIRPQWLKAETDAGLQSASLEYTGALVTKITLGEESLRVNTATLHWRTLGAEQDTQIAIITNTKGTTFRNADGKAISGFVKMKPGAMMPVLEVLEDSYYVLYKGAWGYVNRKDAALLSPAEEPFQTGIISLNGRTSGSSTINVREEPSGKSKQIGEWKVGTPVAIVSRMEIFSCVEGKGIRGWVENKYLTVEEDESDGQEINEGK